MSLEAVQKVTESEQKAQQDRAEAAAQATHLVAAAEKAGQARLDMAKAEAELRVKALIAQAEERAAQHTEAVMDETRRTCDSLRHEAEGRLSDAAALIVGKVVGSECQS